MKALRIQSACPVCQRGFRLGWQGLHERWPRWVAVFLGVWLIGVMWLSARNSGIPAGKLGLLYGANAALAWILTLAVWFFVDGGHDAEQHRSCLPRTWKMWLVPPMFALACVLGAVVMGGIAYAAISVLQYLRH